MDTILIGPEKINCEIQYKSRDLLTRILTLGVKKTGIIINF